MGEFTKCVVKWLACVVQMMNFFRKGREFLTRLYKTAADGLIYLFTGR